MIGRTSAGAASRSSMPCVRCGGLLPQHPTLPRNIYVFLTSCARRRERNREQGAAASESDRTFFGAAIISLRQYGLELLMIAGAPPTRHRAPAGHKQVDGGREACC